MKQNSYSSASEGGRVHSAFHLTFHLQTEIWRFLTFTKSRITKEHHECAEKAASCQVLHSIPEKSDCITQQGRDAFIAPAAHPLPFRQCNAKAAQLSPG